MSILNGHTVDIHVCTVTCNLLKPGGKYNERFFIDIVDVMLCYVVLTLFINVVQFGINTVSTLCAFKLVYIVNIGDTSMLYNMAGTSLHSDHLVLNSYHCPHRNVVRYQINIVSTSLTENSKFLICIVFTSLTSQCC